MKSQHDIRDPSGAVTPSFTLMKTPYQVKAYEKLNVFVFVVILAARTYCPPLKYMRVI